MVNEGVDGKIRGFNAGPNFMKKDVVEIKNGYCISEYLIGVIFSS